MESAFRVATAPFTEHVTKYSLVFDDTQSFSRAHHEFLKNDKTIREFNSRLDETFTLGHNKFSHLSFEQFKKIYGSASVPKDWTSEASPTSSLTPTDNDAIDWSTDHDGVAVSGIMDQGDCGSCWAFSTVGAIEGMLGIANNKPADLSEQQLVSCDTNNNDCAGGWMPSAFTYVADNGLCSEDSYPYLSADGAVPACAISTCTPTMVNFTQNALPDLTEDSLKNAVASQPVAVAVCANEFWQLYKSGVMSHVNSTCHDHGVLVVGFGNDLETESDFWKIKNSWGRDYGEEGYIRIQRNVDVSDQYDVVTGPCGLLTFANFPTLQ